MDPEVLCGISGNTQVGECSSPSGRDRSWFRYTTHHQTNYCLPGSSLGMTKSTSEASAWIQSSENPTPNGQEKEGLYLGSWEIGFNLGVITIKTRGRDPRERSLQEC